MDYTSTCIIIIFISTHIYIYRSRMMNILHSTHIVPDLAISQVYVDALIDGHTQTHMMYSTGTEIMECLMVLTCRN